MRVFRTDDPATNPVMRLDSTAKRPVREFWTRDLEPQSTRTPALRDLATHDNATTTARPKLTPEQQARRDAAERLRARQDEALADIKGMHRRRGSGFYKSDVQASGSPVPHQPDATGREDMADSIRDAYKRRSRGFYGEGA